MALESVPSVGEHLNGIDPTGHELAGYVFGDVIGGGGMADVYTARQVGLDRSVAIKVMKPWLATDREFVARFLREARVCARLVHPNVVQVHDLGYHLGNPCLVMELLEGQTLADSLEEAPMALEDTISIIQDVLKGLSAAHTHGIIHRDVKPGNVFLCDDGSVKVMDFGIAHATGATHLTDTGVPMGTPEYMSPEQVEGKKPDARSDIYTVGILMYRMLSGSVPFTADTPIAVLMMHVSKPPPELPLSVPEWLRSIVMRALAKHPDDRFASVSEMLAAFQNRRVLDLSPQIQSPVTLMSGMSAVNWPPLDSEEIRYIPSPTYPSLLPTPTRLIDDGRDNNRKVAIIATAAVSVVLLTGILGYALNTRTRHAPSSTPQATPAALAPIGQPETPATYNPGAPGSTLYGGMRPGQPNIPETQPGASLPPPQTLGTRPTQPDHHETIGPDQPGVTHPEGSTPQNTGYPTGYGNTGTPPSGSNPTVPNSPEGQPANTYPYGNNPQYPYPPRTGGDPNGMGGNQQPAQPPANTGNGGQQYGTPGYGAQPPAGDGNAGVQPGYAGG